MKDFGIRFRAFFLKIIFLTRWNISYNILKDFGIRLEDFFWRLYFYTVKYLSFHNSSFVVRYFSMCIARPQCDTPPFLLFLIGILRDLPQQKNPRALCQGSSHPPQFCICSHVPMEIFLFSKTQAESKSCCCDYYYYYYYYYYCLSWTGIWNYDKGTTHS